MNGEYDESIPDRLDGISSDIERVSSEVGSISRGLKTEAEERKSGFRWTVGVILAIAGIFIATAIPLFMHPIGGLVDDVGRLRASVESLATNVGHIKGAVNGYPAQIVLGACEDD